MKVLFFSHQADFLYGGEICTLSFMQELSKLGWEVHFASPAGPYHHRARKFARCHLVDSKQFSRRLTQLPALLPALASTHRQLEKIMAVNGISILHATSLKAMAYAWPLAKRRAVIWHHHDILPRGFANDWWLRLLGARAKVILAPSEATRVALVEAGISPEKALVLHNGFSIRDWQSRPARTPSPKFRVAMVGEISPRKGTDRLPGILRALSERGGVDGFEFVIVGDGLSAPEFASEMRQTLKGQPVTFLGRREDVRQILQGMDLLLVPSRQDPLPTVIVEASLSGVPAIGSTAGGIPEMIAEGETGYLADSDEQYADALMQARELPNWLRLSRGARAMAEEKFNIQVLTKELAQIYGKLL